MADAEDDDAFLTCDICGADKEWVDCWYGCEDGFFHDCGEDCCACARPEPNEPCPECRGAGGWFECTRLPHTAEIKETSDA